jgi:hypothetical protein
MILGGPDIIPHQRFRAFADEEDVPTDLPYQSNEPYSTNPQKFLSPSRVVGRLPDITGSTDVNYLLGLIDYSVKSVSHKANDYGDYFALTVNWWKESTSQSLKNIFGNDSKLQRCPPEGTPFKKQEFKPRVHFYNCHGGEDEGAFFGQLRETSDTPACISSSELKGNITEGTVVASECCFGAQLFNPNDTESSQPGIANTYLAGGAYAFVGSTTSAYGPESGQGLADLVTQYFIKNIQRGASAGRAFLEAQQKFIEKSSPYFDRFELKTLCQFMLLADPSINPVNDEAIIKANCNATEIRDKEKSEVEARKDRRVKLIAKGKSLGQITHAPEKVKAAVSPKLKKEINTILGEYSYRKTTGETDGFKKKTRVNDGAKAIGLSPKEVRFHVYTKSNGKPALPFLCKEKVLVLKEIKGKITEVREYIRKTPHETFTGVVAKEKVMRGSKSERVTLVLKTASWELPLRRRGGDPFYDSYFEDFIGKKVKVEGVKKISYLQVHDIRIE